MNLFARVDAFKAAYPDRPASWPCVVHESGRAVLYARWLIGNDYRSRSTFYGPYPPGFLDRVLALFPDVPQTPAAVLHVFSGSLGPGPYRRLDLRPSCAPDVVGDVLDVGRLFPQPFRLVLADPPYSPEDSAKYGTPPLARGRALAALASVVEPGGFLTWFDTVWPMHSKRQWVTVGRIAVTRSTNHRLRDLTIFERVGR